MVRIMTLNLNRYGERHGKWKKRRELIVEAVRRIAPDIIALQAVRRVSDYGDGLDQASQLAVLLPKYRRVIFHTACVTEQYTDGSAILARYPDVETSSRPFSVDPNGADKEQHLLLRAMVHMIGGDLRILNGHLSWAEDQNQRNVDELLPELERAGSRTVLAGDFNQPPDSPGCRRLAQAGWVDCWEKLHPGQPGFTFESDRPEKRIDYIFLSPDLGDRLRACEVVRVEEHGTRMSDHLAVYADIEL